MKLYYKIIDNEGAIHSVISIDSKNPKSDIIDVTIDRPNRFFKEIDYKTFQSIKRKKKFPTHLITKGYED